MCFQHDFVQISGRKLNLFHVFVSHNCSCAARTECLIVQVFSHKSANSAILQKKTAA